MSPVVVIPRNSPHLEAIARAVLWGVRSAATESEPALVIAKPGEELDLPTESSPVIVGWRGDLEDSRRDASATLTALARRTPTPHWVALFEGHVVEADGSISAIASDLPVEDIRLRHAVPIERFAIIQRSGGPRPSRAELHRARRWGAFACSPEGWEPASAPSTTVPATEAPAKWMSWCGAME